MDNIEVSEEKVCAQAAGEKSDAPQTAADSRKKCCEIKIFLISFLTALIVILIYHCIMTFWKCGDESKCLPPAAPAVSGNCCCQARCAALPAENMPCREKPANLCKHDAPEFHGEGHHGDRPERKRRFNNRHNHPRKQQMQDKEQ